MTQYVLNRVALSLPSLVIVSVMIFALVRIIPGDVLMARVAESGYLSPEDLAEIRAELGIDRPFIQQYFSWMGGLFQGDFGKSLWSDRSVISMLAGGFRISGQMALMAMGLAVVIAIPLGVISAVKRNSGWDYGARLLSISGLSIPDFFIGTMVILVLSLYVGWLPQFGYFSPIDSPRQNFEAMFIPVLIVGFRFSAISARMMRSTMLEVMRQDYIRTARAKGLTGRAVIFRHAVRNALLPVVTIMGSQLTSLMGGLVVIETLFSLPGLGRIMFDAVIIRDYPVIQGGVMAFAILYVVSNLLVDLSYALIDPRIKYQ